MIFFFNANIYHDFCAKNFAYFHQLFLDPREIKMMAKLRNFVICISFLYFTFPNEVIGKPLFQNRRTFEGFPNFMEIVARKMGVIDFFANFVKGIKSIFIPK